ncbi:flavin-containing monooxygenase [Phenylobacterium terrae]|uniref:Flavin-containing monooxygenase n=1 Tax=Phenylobacterium terrae TaxID=2665495 RepID=A0ABW4MY46_9CAUL
MTMTAAAAPSATKTEHVDVLIVGAGVSGIGAAYHLKDQTPGTSFLVVDALDNFGGTWWTHKYPGIRSDSDLYTFGYRFKPWLGDPIATADKILAYMGEVIEENDLGRHIRYRHKITDASWDSATSLWNVEGVRTDTNEPVRFTTNFLWMCQGYYKHDQGYTPEWPGMADFKGEIVHPQTWPQDIELKGKKVVVIGSGATAATLVPSIANEVAHVTMLQRSPTYFTPGRNADELADTLRALKIDPTWIHEIVRRQRLHMGNLFTKRAFSEPEAVKKELLGMVKASLPEGYDVEKHFTPKYLPWRQRIAFVPDGDLFKGIREGKASVVTDEIERFVEGGLLLKSGETLEADIIVTATGFNMCVLGDIAFVVDGQRVDFAKTVTWRGMMFTGVPNLVWVFGYFRASWTLRADLLGDFVCRLLKHMKAKGVTKVTTELRPEEKDMELLPWMDPDNFNPSYLMRALHLMPKRGASPEWQHTQDYMREAEELPAVDLDDSVFHYGKAEAPARAREPTPA